MLARRTLVEHEGERAVGEITFSDLFSLPECPSDWGCVVTIVIDGVPTSERVTGVDQVQVLLNAFASARAQIARSPRASVLRWLGGYSPGDHGLDAP